MKQKIGLMGVSLTLMIGIMAVMDYSLETAYSQVEPEKEKSLQEQVATAFNYVHKADLNRASITLLLNGISLIQNDTLLIYDSTPFATKGHISLNLPCNPEEPNKPMFQVLIGLAPKVFPMYLGYLEQVSNPPRSCLFHGQFGFGDPVTDVALKYTESEEVHFLGPHTITITAHESYIPSQELFKQKQHLAP